MLNSWHKVIFYSFVAFVLSQFSTNLFIKQEHLFADSSKRNASKNRIPAHEKKKQEELPIKEIAPQTGYMAPDFTFFDTNGKSVSLSQFRGKIVFLNVWATWCEPCRIEMPDMEKLYRKFKKEGLVILAVSIDQQGMSIIKPFVQELGLTFPILLSPDERVLEIYMVSAIPASFIIDKTGRIAARLSGAREWFGSEAIKTFEYLIRKT